MKMSPFKLLCILISLLNIGVCFPLSCPNLEDLRPCNCRRLAYGLQVICANFNDTNVLKRVFKILRDYRVHTVVLHGLYPKETLPSDIFSGLQIKEIRVEKSCLTFSEPAFRGLDSSLNILNVGDSSMIKSKDRFSLAKLTKLDELNVQHIKLERVEDKWLNDKVPNVHTIILDYNDISEVESHAFGNLAMLKVVSLADNRIKKVQRSMLPQPAEYLMRIDLSFNELRSLPSDFFAEMPSLKEIILTQNELTTIPEKTWKPVWPQLTQVFLLDNNVDCGDYINWIKIHRPYQLEGNCGSPKEMAGKSLIAIYKT